MENFVLESITYNGTNEPILGNGVFESCRLLDSITVPQKYEGDTFGGYSINKSKAVSVYIWKDMIDFKPVCKNDEYRY